MPNQVDSSVTKPYIYNQAGTGLAIRSPSGDIEELADISLGCRNAISTANLSHKDYLWSVKYNHEGVQKKVFVKKSIQLDPHKFEAAIDSQHGLPFSMILGPYRKYWAKFVNEKVAKVLQEQNSVRFKEHFFVEVLGLQVQIIKAGDGPEKERWVFGPDVVLDFEGKPMTGANCDMFWYRWV